MNNNTVVTACNGKYIWGAYLLAASLRKNGMDEPVLVYAVDFTPEQKRCLQAIPDVRVVDAPATSRSLTCSKPTAMLLAETEYITWVDCDGYFLGNTSEWLIPPSPDEIHVRMRGEAENKLVYPAKRFGENGGRIPDEVLTVWRQDIPQAEAVPQIPRCCSACFLSLHASHRDMLRLWADQMAKVLPEGDIGVVDKRQRYYHQLDESVLNSVLCFMPHAPKVTPTYQLDKDPQRIFIHFVCQPKPWIGWTPWSIRHWDSYLSVVEYAQAQNWELPQNPPPFSLQRRNAGWCRWLCYVTFFRYKLRRLQARFF